ncbi:efflux RND transporter periplasmic adaptor subunit [Pseudomonas putida]|uniref:efflux RND transporter periplasmic adaptor subunit n=1 Tax=Pseudomonas putida TaxID=303 RepID=UPI0034D4E281
MSSATQRVGGKLVLTALVLSSALGGLYLYDLLRKREAQAAAQAAGEPAPIAVVVANASGVPLAKQVDTIGTVVADHQVLVAAEVAGRITRIHFTSGQKVDSGMALVQLNDGPLRSEMERRRVALRLAQTDLERARRLHGQTMSSADYERYVAAYAEAQALLEQAREEAAQRLVRAPFNGELGVRQVNLGQYVEAGTPIATLTDPTVLHVDFNVPERYRDLLRTGLAARIQAHDGQQAASLGSVTAIDPQISKENRAIRVRATLPPQTPISPGQFVHVSLQLPPGAPTTTVPTVALESSLTGDFLYVLRRDGERQTAHRLAVSTGQQSEDRTEVLGEVIAPEDLVVISGQINLQDGAQVTSRIAETPAVDERAVGQFSRKEQ